METIYLDSLLLTNFVIDYFLLLVTGRICAMTLRRGRIALGAAVGSAYALTPFLPGGGFLAALPVKLLWAALMMLTAYGREKRLLRGCAAYLVLAAAFGGVVWAAAPAAMETGGAYIPVSMKVLVLAFGLCYAAVLLVFNRRFARMEREKQSVEVTLQGRTAALQALVDTGNTLFDPLSGRKVLVAEAAALEPLFSGLSAAALREDPAEGARLLSALPEYAGRVRLISYAALGNAHGMLLAFRPDAVRAGGKPVDALIAVSPQRLSPDAEYNAIY